MKRQAEIDVALGSRARLIGFHSAERLSQPFQIEAEVVLEDRVDILPALGKPACITVYEVDAPVRYFHGLVIEAHHLRQTDEGHHYALVLRPWLHLLDSNRAYRIFEQKTVVQMLRDVLAPHSRHIDYGGLTETYRPWPYCAQYRESDLSFVMRLMEREGIYFYFRHEKGEHTMVLCDSRAAHKPSPRAATVKLRPDLVGGHGTEDSLWEWHEHVRSGGERRVLIQSFDYEKTLVRDGRADGGTRGPADTQEIHDYTGDFVDPTLAKHWAQVRLEAARADQRVYTGSGDTIGIACGGLFKLDSTDAFDRGREFIVTTLDYAMDAEPWRSDGDMARREVSIEAITSQTKWRAPIVTPAPFAGPVTAIVIEGGADDSRVDRMGRVRVRFLWKKSDEADIKARSCWLRVSHPSAGASFGHVTLPRLDEEVIVDFLNGNPDRPIVTGRVYNSRHQHAYALPANRTRSLYRSNTIGKMGSYAGAETRPRAPAFNELSFDDKGGAEEVYLRAQRNRRTDVLYDDAETVNRDQANRVGRDRETAVRRNDSTTVETGNHSLTITRGASTVQARQRIMLRVGTSRVLMTPATITVAQGTSRITMTSTSITLAVGPNMISLTPAGITLNGTTITGNALSALTWEGTVSTIHGKAAVNVLGGAVVIA